jgi:hypothetical protein
MRFSASKRLGLTAFAALTLAAGGISAAQPTALAAETTPKEATAPAPLAKDQLMARRTVCHTVDEGTWWVLTGQISYYGGTYCHSH